MASYNRIILVGNLTSDPQLKFLPSQMAVCEIRLAVNNRYKTAAGEQRDEVCYVDCTAFGKQGEVINQYMQKGRPILVEGRLKFDQWEDKQGGGKRSKHSVVIDNFQFMGGRDDAPAGAGGDRAGGDRANGDRAGGFGARGGYTMDAAGGGGDESQVRRGPSRPAPKPAAKPAEDAPFDDEQKHFEEEDIPF